MQQLFRDSSNILGSFGNRSNHNYSKIKHIQPVHIIFKNNHPNIHTDLSKLFGFNINQPVTCTLPISCNNPSIKHGGRLTKPNQLSSNQSSSYKHTGADFKHFIINNLSSY
ncbi:hypothetical protein HanIR_Chr17g0886041 [Helianthus annuus]|nr:hypothetical protein HanIR_Chr17g0886041 [Helianthus annuus]